ncbi:hypothetical protein [Rhizobium leguminosarum]|uniref:hypothetical protein n=1 Tax=Rhizobium leguminosarum TaxID=384 RepID=UPI001494BF29|nr:hypothetical protein [Rhizobium leguminosarum]
MTPRSPPRASLQTEGIVTTLKVTAAMTRVLLFEGNYPSPRKEDIVSFTHLSEIDDPTDIGLIRMVLRSAGFRGSHAVADPEEKRAALTFLKSEFRNGVSSENDLLSALKRRDDLLPPALRRMQGISQTTSRSPEKQAVAK